MSFNQIYDNNILAPLDVPQTKNIKANNIRCKNLNAVTINGNIPTPPLPSGVNGEFLRLVAGQPDWVQFQTVDIPNGPSNSLLYTDPLNNVSWSQNPAVNNFTVNGQLNSVTSNMLNNVNILNTLRINNTLPAPNQVVGTDGLGVLNWQNVGSAQIKKLYCYANNGFDINQFVSTAVQYQPTSFDTLAGDVTRPTNQIFQFNTNGEFTVSADISCLASNSVIEVQILNNGLTILCTSLLDVASTFCNVNYTGNFLNGDLLSIVCVRVGLNATAKLLQANNTNSAITITKLN